VTATEIRDTLNEMESDMTAAGRTILTLRRLGIRAPIWLYRKAGQQAAKRSLVAERGFAELLRSRGASEDLIRAAREAASDADGQS
jgi:hypothetical protein